MSQPQSDFLHSTAPEPHRDRTKQILRLHPEVRTLIGPSPTTFWYILGLVGLQFAVAWFVADRPVWLVVVLAYTVGAFVSHGLFVMIHECAHRLVFRRRLPNILTGLVANLPLFVPGSFSFQNSSVTRASFPLSALQIHSERIPLGSVSESAIQRLSGDQVLSPRRPLLSRATSRFCFVATSSARSVPVLSVQAMVFESGDQARPVMRPAALATSSSAGAEPSCGTT